MKKYLIIITTLSIGFSSYAQKTKMVLSLDEAIQIALKNSYNTKASKNNVLSAKETVWETTATGLPQISAKYKLSKFHKTASFSFASSSF